MPEGAPVAVEGTLAEDVDVVRRDIMLRGVAAMGQAKYKLADQGESTFTFSRRYLPRVARNACVLVVLVAVFVQTGNGGEVSPALAAGWIAVLAMIFYRRTETVTVDLRSVERGTRLIAAGVVSKSGRAVLGEIMAGVAASQGIVSADSNSSTAAASRS